MWMEMSSLHRWMHYPGPSASSVSSPVRRRQTSGTLLSSLGWVHFTSLGSPAAKYNALCRIFRLHPSHKCLTVLLIRIDQGGHATAHLCMASTALPLQKRCEDINDPATKRPPWMLELMQHIRCLPRSSPLTLPAGPAHSSTLEGLPGTSYLPDIVTLMTRLLLSAVCFHHIDIY